MQRFEVNQVGESDSLIHSPESNLHVLESLFMGHQANLIELRITSTVT
jgi:hypothetical protein